MFPMIEDHFSRDRVSGGEVTAPLPHSHHWVIEEPAGEFSPGQCVKCGTVKQFRNWLQPDFLMGAEMRLIRTESAE